MYAAWTLNQTSCYPQTPYLLVAGRKPLSPQFYFGRTGLFQTRRKDSPDIRAEWGIFLSYGDGAGIPSLRAYIHDAVCTLGDISNQCPPLQPKGAW